MISVLIPGAITFVSALLLQAAGIPVSAEPIRFLPDDAQVACRAILPQCFRLELGQALSGSAGHSRIPSGGL